MGIRYIGACCGMEPYHVRAIAEEASSVSKLLYQNAVLLCVCSFLAFHVNSLCYAFSLVGSRAR